MPGPRSGRGHAHGPGQGQGLPDERRQSSERAESRWFESTVTPATRKVPRRLRGQGPQAAVAVAGQARQPHLRRLRLHAAGMQGCGAPAPVPGARPSSRPVAPARIPSAEAAARAHHLQENGLSASDGRRSICGPPGQAAAFPFLNTAGGPRPRRSSLRLGRPWPARGGHGTPAGIRSGRQPRRAGQPSPHRLVRFSGR